MYNPSFKGDVCSHKHGFLLDNLIRKFLQNPKKILAPYLRPGDLAVDLGCGPGFFTLEMAQLVGPRGRVLAVDLQPEMLAKVEKKARALNLALPVETILCTQESLNLPDDLEADFFLAFYMVHETLNPDLFFRQVREAMKPGARFLVVEPPFHVTRSRFAQIEQSALTAGFKILDRPRGYRSLLLTL